jgi:hypothetical protein
MYAGLSISWPVLVLLCLVVGAYAKGRPWSGFFLGLFLGPFGLVLVFLLPDRRPKCPVCRVTVDPEALICPHCHTNLKTNKPKTSPEDEAFCMKCGKDGIKSFEMGEVVAICPQCGQRL